MELEGRQVGAEAVIVAQVDGVADILTAEAWVKVVSVRDVPPPPPPPTKKGGLFKDFQFDPTAEPRQRVKYERSTSNIIIATKAPSVALYLGEEGDGIDTPQAQVMLAELLTEAVCRELARRGVESEIYIAPAGGQADAIQRKYIELQNQYAHRIHACFVDSNFQRNTESKVKRGRPTREETLASSVTAAG